MPYIGITPQARVKMQISKRRAALYRITDPLWIAIHNGHNQDVAKLMADLRLLVDKDRAKQA